MSPLTKDLSPLAQSGRYPTSCDPYSKILMEWFTPTLITEDGVYEVEAGVNQAYKIERGFDASEPEYLLIENRQPIGYDSKMDGGGSPF